MNTIALLEVLDRDGHVRNQLPIGGWPIRIGRALDNHLVLDDPHVAAHHCRLDADAGGVFVQAGDTLNGLRADGHRLARGERRSVGSEPLRLDVGDSHLRLRLAEHALAPELALHAPRSLWHAAWPIAAAALIVLAMLLFSTWLDVDPDQWNRALGSVLLAALTAGVAWCAAWSLLSKIFTRRSHLWWHVRVLLLGVLAVELGGTALRLMAFSYSWPRLSDFTFVWTFAVIAAMLYFHALGVEPRRPTRLGLAAAGMFIAAIGLSLWSNHQNRDQFGDELYMSHLFPPAFRVARPLDTAAFVQGLAPLQPTLDRKAKERDSGSSETDDDAPLE